MPNYQFERRVSTRKFGQTLLLVGTLAFGALGLVAFAIINNSPKGIDLETQGALFGLLPVAVGVFFVVSFWLIKSGGEWAYLIENNRLKVVVPSSKYKKWFGGESFELDIDNIQKITDERSNKTRIIQIHDIYRRSYSLCGPQFGYIEMLVEKLLEINKDIEYSKKGFFD